MKDEAFVVVGRVGLFEETVSVPKYRSARYHRTATVMFLPCDGDVIGSAAVPSVVVSFSPLPRLSRPNNPLSERDKAPDIDNVVAPDRPQGRFAAIRMIVGQS